MQVFLSSVSLHPSPNRVNFAVKQKILPPTCSGLVYNLIQRYFSYTCKLNLVIFASGVLIIYLFINSWLSSQPYSQSLFNNCNYHFPYTPHSNKLTFKAWKRNFLQLCWSEFSFRAYKTLSLPRIQRICNNDSPALNKVYHQFIVITNLPYCSTKLVLLQHDLEQRSASSPHQKRISPNHHPIKKNAALYCIPEFFTMYILAGL